MSESSHESKITQDVVGQGNIFTGQGDIHVQACPFASSQSEDRRWLKALADSVKLTWIRDVLEKSMGQTEMIPLRKQALPEAVQLRSEHVVDEALLTPARTLETPNGAAAPLPADKKIREICEEAGRFLLILGEPGSGEDHHHARPCPLVASRRG